MRWIVVVLLLPLPLSSLAAQRRPEPLALAPVEAASRPSPAPAQRTARPAAETDEAWQAIGGLLAGAAGFFMGGYLGANALCGTDNADEFCSFVGFFWGGAAGESLLLPIGVHHLAGGHGSLAAEILASTLIGAAGMAVAFKANDAKPLLVVPILQLAAVMTMERAAARRGPAR